MGLSLARSTIFNLAGHVAPLAAAVVVLPLLVSRLAPESFGFLSLAWGIVGYFNLFDLGLGRALSRLVAERIGTSREDELLALTRTALFLTFMLGVLAGAMLFMFAPWTCATLFNVPSTLRAEAITALRLLAVCLPLVTLTAALRGILEAGQRFGWVNAIRIPLGILTFVGPALVVLQTDSLVALVAVLAALRVVGVAAHWLVCARLYPRFTTMGAPTAAAFSEMFGFGAWLTVSNLVGPLFVYLDRFVIGATLSVAAVAYYSVPYEVVTRLWLVPAALSGVLFPAFAAAIESDPERAARLYRVGFKAVLLATFPLTFAATLFAPEWMALWLGPDYAARGVRVAQILSIGVLVNCLAYLPFTLLQALGRADLTARAHIAEFPVYVALLAALTTAYGIEGAALAWSVRCAADAAVLFFLARRVLPGIAPVLRAAQQTTCALFFAFMFGALLPGGSQLRGLYLAAVMLVFCALGWFVLLTAEERRIARHPAALLAGEVSR